MNSTLNKEQIQKELEGLAIFLPTEMKYQPIPVDIMNQIIPFLVQDYNFPSKYIELYFEDLAKEVEKPEILNRVKDYIVNLTKFFFDGKGLFIAGPVGTGKTTLAVIIAKYIMAAMTFPDIRNNLIRNYFHGLNFNWPIGSTKPMYFWNAVEILHDYFANREMFKKKTAVPFLFIDDVSKVSTEVYKEALDYILRFREQNALPVIMTNQAPLSTMADNYGLAIADLIKGNNQEIIITGKTRRGK